jgi:2-methylcitrate dehydratase PrpD
VKTLDAILDHIAATDLDRLPPPVVTATKTVIRDSLACGIVGSSDSAAAPLCAALAARSGGPALPVWGQGTRAPAFAAAMANAYQVHGLEYAAVHERATVHSMSAIFPTVMAYADMTGAVTGADLIVAVNIGNDIACLLGLAATEGARFFRPGVCGAMGAAAALAKLARLDRTGTKNLFGLVYSQLSGTMQAHTEASMALALQIAFSTRNVLTALDLVQAGMTGPHDVFDGPFGYFALFERNGAAAPHLADLGRAWRTAELSFKPYPSGRASHGAIDALAQLMAAHGFTAADVAEITLAVPPFVHRLGGRPMTGAMTPAYARLCLPFLVAALLRDGFIDVRTYRPENLTSPELRAIAAGVHVAIDGNPDVNALAPQHVTVRLTGGPVLTRPVPVLLGHPAYPMTTAQHHAKLANACTTAAAPLPEGTAERLADAVQRLETLPDVSVISVLAAGLSPA